MSYQMIDVSSDNVHPIDWCQVAKDGVRAVMIKATEGETYVNPDLGRDAHGARAAGLHVGYYHFARPSVGDAAKQAGFAISKTASLPRDIGLALDLEVTEGMRWTDLATWAKNFLGYVAGRHIGSPLYVNEFFLDNLPGAPFGHKLWLASWGKRPRREVWAWQYSGTATLPGEAGEFDRSVYYG